MSEPSLTELRLRKAEAKLAQLIERLEWIEHSCPISSAAREELRAAIEETKL